MFNTKRVRELEETVIDQGYTILTLLGQVVFWKSSGARLEVINTRLLDVAGANIKLITEQQILLQNLDKENEELKENNNLLMDGVEKVCNESIDRDNAPIEFWRTW
jgi:hypothetical protein